MPEKSEPKRATCSKCGAHLRSNNLGPYCSPCGDGLRREEFMRKGLGLPPIEDEPAKKD